MAVLGETTITKLKVSETIQGNISGNAATATSLNHSFTVNGAVFNGSENKSVTVPNISSVTVNPTKVENNVTLKASATLDTSKTKLTIDLDVPKGNTGATGPALDYSWGSGSNLYKLGIKKPSEDTYTYSQSLRGASGATSYLGIKSTQHETSNDFVLNGGADKKFYTAYKNGLLLADTEWQINSGNKFHCNLAHSIGDTYDIIIVEYANSTVAANSASQTYVDNKASNYLPTAGGTVTGKIDSSFESGTWINSVTNAAFNLRHKGYGGIFSAPVNSGRIAVSTYPSSNNNVYLGYAETGKTENSFTRSMYWNADDGNLYVRGKTVSLSGHEHPADQITTGTMTGDLTVNGTITGTTVKGAVWNDFADCIEVPEETEIEPGYCYITDGVSYKKSTKYCQKSLIGIHSDTYGMSIGKKERQKELDIAVSGFVLAHVDRIYESGTPLTCTRDGKLTKMKRRHVKKYPERLVGTFWKAELSKEWGSSAKKVEVDGRCWIKIK